MDGKKPLFSAEAAEEYFSTLLTYYRNTGNDIFKRDNEGRHVSDQIYSAEYQKYLGMQIAMREVLEYFAKFELGDTAIRQQDATDKDVGKNEPLTLDELRRMEGQPVYIVENTEYWAIVNSFDQAGVYLLSYGNPDDYGYFGLYGKTWLAYRQKPEEDDKHEP